MKTDAKFAPSPDVIEAGMKHLPWRECGYAIGFILVLAAIYVGSYYAMVRREYSPPFSSVWGTDEDDREFVRPKYSHDDMADFFRPMHEIDRRLRREYWSMEDAKKEWKEQWLKLRSRTK